MIYVRANRFHLIARTGERYPTSMFYQRVWLREPHLAEMRVRSATVVTREREYAIEVNRFSRSRFASRRTRSRGRRRT